MAGFEGRLMADIEGVWLAAHSRCRREENRRFPPVRTGFSVPPALTLHVEIPMTLFSILMTGVSESS